MKEQVIFYRVIWLLFKIVNHDYLSKSDISYLDNHDYISKLGYWFSRVTIINPKNGHATQWGFGAVSKKGPQHWFKHECEQGHVTKLLIGLNMQPGGPSFPLLGTCGETQKFAAMVLGTTLVQGPGSNFLGTNLEWFEAKWILKLDCTLVPSLILGSSNQELSF